MVIPILCSVMRESFSQAPLGEREGAYALGATRWGMIRTVVLPFGKGGIIGGHHARARPGPGGDHRGHPDHLAGLHRPTATSCSRAATRSPALIANLVSESSPFGISALMAAGLALFALTLVVNFSASAVVARSRSGAESDG